MGRDDGVVCSTFRYGHIPSFSPIAFALSRGYPWRVRKIIAFIILVGSMGRLGWGTRIPDAPESVTVLAVDVQEDGSHNVGKRGSHGWEVDYKRDRPGYAFSGLKTPWLLEPGLYRTTFVLRRGHYPRKGLLFKSYGLFRIELWDITLNKIITQRELQIGDFAKAGGYEQRWLEFSMSGRAGHALEPRVFWVGLGNGEIGAIRVDRFPTADPKKLLEKAQRLGEQTLRENLENGFVVSREEDGQADETGDATTYTSFYVASLAWKYATTHDEMTYQALENGLATLHNAIKGTVDEPLLTRFVEEEGTPFPKSPSKDVYTSFFLAMSAAYPHITNPALKKQMRWDVERIAEKFLRDDLRIKCGSQTLVSLTPYLTPEEIQSGIQILLNDNRKLKKFVKTLKLSKRYLPFGELWPGMKEVIRGLEKKDEKRLMELVVPTMNGAFMLAERVRDVLREQYREDLFPKRFNNKEYPGIKLADQLNIALKRFPKKNNDQRLSQLSDLKVLSSNALISLHIIKTAAVITGKPQFVEYYRSNLYTQDALLKTALDWGGIEEDLTKLTAGNPTADTERRGYLGTLALANLMSLEENESIKESYRTLILRDWNNYRHEDNPLMAILSAASLKPTDSPIDLVMRALSLYPENRSGFGPDYWDDYGTDVAEIMGGGEQDGYAREPLPISHRPKDSFLWQRNSRRLKGDTVKSYPATDYLFVYWYGRAQHLLPAPPQEPVASH